MEGIPAQRSVRTSATPAMMKRVGGGYVLRAPSVEPSQQEQRVTRPPTNEAQPRMSRAMVAIQPATRRTSTAPTRNRVGTLPVVQSRITNPPQAQPRTSRATVAIQPATRRATTFPTRNRVGTVAVAQSGRAETTETYQTDSSEVTQWKEEKEALAATLANKSEQLRDALEHEGRLNCEVEDLKKNLQTSRNKNAECQKQLDDALMTHLQDEQTIKTATEVHEELKADVARSVARSRQMLEGFETFMEEQGKQLEALQVARNKPTTSSTPPAQSTQVNTDVIVQHGIHAMEKFYKKHRERDQRKLEIALEQNEELKQEVGRSREMLIEFKGFMENQMKEMEAWLQQAYLPDDLIPSSQMHEPTEPVAALGNQLLAIHDLITSCEQQPPTRASGSRSIRTDFVTQEATYSGGQARTCYDLITSLRTHFIPMKMLLKSHEYNNEILQMQLDEVLK